MVGDGGYLDGNTKGCRILHSAFAETNDKHCPHLSFVPEEDYLGRVKCQSSGGVQPEDLFSDQELTFFQKYGEEHGLPRDTLFAECEVANVDPAPSISPTTKSTKSGTSGGSRKTSKSGVSGGSMKSSKSMKSGSSF